MIPFHEFTKEDRLFVLNTNGNPEDFYCYFTGKTADGQQVLQAWYAGENPYIEGMTQAQLVWFDSGGNIISTESVALPLLPAAPPPWSSEDITQGCRTVRRHMGTLGVVPGPIRVRHFWLEEPFRMGISLLPPWLPEQIWDPYSIPGSQNLEEALYGVNVVVGNKRFGDFRLFWGEEVFGVCGDNYPYDHPDRALPPGPPLHLFPDRLHTLRTYGPRNPGPYFYTGTLPDGRQGLMGWHHDNVVCLLFDAQGILCEATERPTGFEFAQIPEGANPELAAHQQARPVAKAWQKELGWRQGAIRVRPFMHPDKRIFLSDLTRSGVTTLYDPFQYGTVEEREEMRKQLDSWLESESFVLNWMRDYHIDREGNVIST